MVEQAVTGLRNETRNETIGKVGREERARSSLEARRLSSAHHFSEMETENGGERGGMRPTEAEDEQSVPSDLISQIHFLTFAQDKSGQVKTREEQDGGTRGARERVATS